MQETRVWFLTRKIPWQPTPVFLSGNPMDRGAWRAAVLGVTKSQTWFSNQKKKKKTPKQTRLHAKQSSGNQGKNPQSFVTRTTFLSATCQGLKLKIFSFLWEFSTKYPWRRKWQITSAFLPWEPHKQYEKTKRYDIERVNTHPTPRPVGVQYATGEKWRNSSRRNEEA